jgi:hypothetical protein
MTRKENETNSDKRKGVYKNFLSGVLFYTY